MEKREFTQNDLRRLFRFIKSLGRFRNDAADQIMTLLQRQYGGADEQLMEWIDPWVVELAGHMRLKEAIPFVIERMYDDDDTVRDVCGTTLAKIGGDEVVKAIADIWFDSDEEFCGIAVDALEHIHTVFCADKCLEFLVAEEDFEIQLMLGNAVLSQFTLDGVEPVRQLVLGGDDELEPDQFATNQLRRQPFWELRSLNTMNGAMTRLKPIMVRTDINRQEIADHFGSE